MYFGPLKILPVKRSLIPWLLLLAFIIPVSFSACFPEAAVHQKRIDRERKQKEKEARKQYELDLKRHHKSQSKETKAMMKESRRKSKKMTPLKK